MLLCENRSFHQDRPPPRNFVKSNIIPHVILHCQNRSFRQDRPPEISLNIRPHVSLHFENRSFHQDRTPAISSKISDRTRFYPLKIYLFIKIDPKKIRS